MVFYWTLIVAIWAWLLGYYILPWLVAAIQRAWRDSRLKEWLDRRAFARWYAMQPPSTRTELDVVFTQMTHVLSQFGMTADGATEAFAKLGRR